VAPMTKKEGQVKRKGMTSRAPVRGGAGLEKGGGVVNASLYGTTSYKSRGKVPTFYTGHSSKREVKSGGNVGK